jgi:hypothetical protein
MSSPPPDESGDHNSHDKQLRTALEKAHLTLEKRTEALQAFYDSPAPEADDEAGKAKADAALARLSDALDLAENLYTKARDRLAAHQRAADSTLPVVGQMRKLEQSGARLSGMFLVSNSIIDDFAKLKTEPMWSLSTCISHSQTLSGFRLIRPPMNHCSELKMRVFRSTDQSQASLPQ